MADANETLPLHEPVAPPPLLVGRYRVGELLGRGGSGRVHRAYDTIGRVDVAVKFVGLADPAARIRHRRERVALRRLRMPGVVKLIDDGDDGAQGFLVLELLDGGTWADLAGPWPSFAPAVERLLGVLATLHEIGVFHRDLKPGNVLLDRAGQVVLTDFGLALGPAMVREARPMIEGTPRYMAPEQRRGAPADARTDLYAVGVMVWELLAGRRFGEPGPPIDGPEAVVRTLDALLAEDPAGRPRTAREALAALGFSAEPAVPTPTSGRPAALRALFAEDERTFLHIAEDGVRLLRERTGGDPVRVRAELASWVRRGEAWLERGKVALTREALERLRLGPPDLGGASVADAVRAAGSRVRRGRATEATALLQAVAPVVPDARPELRRRWGEHLGWAALSHERLETVRTARYELERVDDPAAREVGALLDAAVAAWTGEIDRADELLGGPRPALHPRLDEWWEGLRVWVAMRRGLEAHRAVLAALAPWGTSGPAERRSLYLSWQGRLAYADQRYAAAYELHRGAVELRRRWPFLRAVSWMKAATAALDGLMLRRAVDAAGEAVRLGRRLRAGLVEGWGVLARALARYRLGDLRADDRGWARAAEQLSADLGARFLLLDATVRWREGAPFADIAEAARAASSTPAERALAGSLAAAGGRSANDLLDLLPGLLPEIGLQCAALLARAGIGTAPRRWRDAIERPADQWSVRLDVLSIAEALAEVEA